MDSFRLSIKKLPDREMKELLPSGSLGGIASAWDMLSTRGGTEGELVEAVTDVRRLPTLFFLLERLDAEGLLCRTVEEDGAAVATLEPMTPGFRFVPAHLTATTCLRLSRFACLRRGGDALVVESGLSRARLILHDERAAAVVAALASPTTLPEVAARLSGVFGEVAVGGLIGLLAAGAFLADDEDAAPELRQWEFHDLLFHASSRRGRHDRPCGATFSFAGSIAPLPAVKEVRGETIVLPAVSPHAAADVFDLLGRRRSLREQGTTPLTLQQVADFLFHTGRIQKVVTTEPGAAASCEIAFRNVPSGGGCAELEIYAAVASCDGLPRGLYRYVGTDHRLEVIAAPGRAFERLLDDAGATYGGVPQVLLVITARFPRVMWKYSSIAYALILKDVGCLQQTMYLVATALGLAPCALGTGDADLFAEAAGLDYLGEGSVGEFVLGTRGA